MISRRTFIKQLTLSGLALLTSTHCFSNNSTDKNIENNSKLILAKDDNLLKDDFELNETILSILLDNSIKNLTDTGNSKDAWSSLFNKDDKVSIKINGIAGKHLTHPQLIYEIIKGLQLAGVKVENIIIWDMKDRDVKRAGFTLNYSGSEFRVFGSDSIGYSDNPIIAKSVSANFSKIVMWSTAIINISQLKDHGIAGITGAMKNFYGAINNPNKYHHNNCNPYIADLYSSIQLQGKIRLTICDGALAQYNGGPGYKAKWTWKYNGFLISTDAIALDYYSWQIIEEQRKIKGLPTLKEVKRHPQYIFTAAEYGLGFSDLDKIDLMEISI